jgi:hypothetical protein
VIEGKDRLAKIREEAREEGKLEEHAQAKYDVEEVEVTDEGELRRKEHRRRRRTREEEEARERRDRKVIDKKRTTRRPTIEKAPS